MSKPWISYVDPATTDAAMRGEFERCAREGTPRPESQAIRAHVPAVFWSFANTWRQVFHEGVLDHSIKELCRVYVSRSVKCEYCGNQRSIKSAQAGLTEDDYLDLLKFEQSKRYGAREKAALAYTDAMTREIDVPDTVFSELRRHFSERQTVELTMLIGAYNMLTRFLKALNVDPEP